MRKRETRIYADGTLGSPLDYSCYRSFLADYLASEKMSYRGFAQRYQAYVSFPLLSKLLRTTNDGRFRAELNLRPERLAALLKAMGLNETEVRHLVLCRLRNDSAPGRYRHASAFQNVLTGLGQGLADARIGDGSGILAALGALAPARLKKVLNEINHQLEVEMTRSESDLKIQTLRGLKLEV